MRVTLQQLRIRNFKVFTSFDLKLEGRHLLLYGPNGSGKSSLYWALYTFLQSARKSGPDISRYFDPAHVESLLNIHEDAEVSPGEIAFTARDAANGQEINYRISKDVHDTHQKSPILKADLASDFITYRFFFGFSNFRNSQRFDIWPLFERELLPFCVSTKGGGSSPQESWNKIKSGVANPSGQTGSAGALAYEEFTKNTATFASILEEIVDSISREAQAFYDVHFAPDDAVKLVLKLRLATSPDYDQTTKKFSLPVIEFGVQIDGKAISRPQTFLNEAKLTQLALSVRLAASLLKLQESDLKLLVLDDLLISLDMNNRMKVVEILLSETFTNYQKIILTHDLGFFQEFRRTIGVSHPDWCFERLEGDPVKGVQNHTEKTELQKAEEHLHGHNLSEAAICLRKAAEDTASRYREWAEQKKLPPSEFFTLTENLRAARNKLLEKVPAQLYEKVLNNTPVAHREHLIPSGDADVDDLTQFDVADRGKIKSKRSNLRTLLRDEHWKAMENVKLIDDVLRTTQRVLNPAAHDGKSPLYETEVRKAMDLIAKLEKCLS